MIKQNPYRIDTSENSIRGPLVSLNILYKEMPETQGCEKCEEINGSEKTWCCRSQNPSMWYVEFLNVWEKAQNWNKEKKINLILRAIRNYLSNKLSKGCIFFDDGCTAYESRPFSCRMYGVVPKENWDKRWDNLKERQGDKFEAKQQCSLVSAKSGTAPTAKDEDEWFKHTVKCEKRIGITPDLIKSYDLPGGTYRTFHDHLLIELYSPEFLNKLTVVRMQNPSDADIDGFISVLREQLNQSM